MNTATGDPPQNEARTRLLDAAVDHFATHGVGDTTLRGLAAGIGTSHRMLIYHFGSRDGLLSAVVKRVEAAQRLQLTELLADDTLAPLEQARRFWARVTDAAIIYGPLFFELSGHAMQGRPHALALRDGLISIWLEPLAELHIRAGWPPDMAPTYARLSLAVARGLFFDLLVTRDRGAVDAAMDTFTSTVFSPRT